MMYGSYELRVILYLIVDAHFLADALNSPYNYVKNTKMHLHQGEEKIRNKMVNQRGRQLEGGGKGENDA